MRRLLMAVPALFVASAAFGLDRYDTTGMSCSEVRAALKSSGKALLQRPSRNVGGMMLYAIYAGDPRVCGAMQTAVRRSVPTADMKACHVLQCVPNDRSRLR